jgi:integrase
VGRPPLPMGTYGAVRLYRTDAGWRARTLYRDWDGVTRHVERNARTQNAARIALVEALRDRARTDNSSVITADTRVSALAQQWLSILDADALSPATLQAYQDKVDRYVLPALGAVRVRELGVGLIDRHLASIIANSGPATAKMTRTVLSGMCGLAVRHEALDTNPCREVRRISTKPKRAPRSLTPDEVRAIRSWLADNKKATDRDLPDLVAFMVGTGLRIGETCAVRWTDVDLSAGTVSVTGTVLRLRGKGLIRKPSPKSESGDRALELPSWCVSVLARRMPTGADPLDLVFGAPLVGGLRDPSNTRRALREAFAEMGLPGLTSHVFRKTVATLMDEAGLPARAAADQLGHAKPAMTMNIYYGRRTRATGAAEVLEQLA